MKIQVAQRHANMKNNPTLAALWENVASGNASTNQRGEQPTQPSNWQYGPVTIMRRPLNVLGSIGLLVVSTDSSGNVWTTTHNPSRVGCFGINRSVDVVTYNSYNMAPPYSGAVNNTNTLYAQQLPITTIGGLTYMYSNQNTYLTPHNSFTQT